MVQDKIGFLGAGRMAQALASGIANADDSINLVVSDPNAEARETFRAKISALPNASQRQRIEISRSNRDLFSTCAIVFLAVKPQHFTQAVEGINPDRTFRPLVVSVMAGISIDRIQQATGCDAIVRIMTNTPCLIGQAASAMACSKLVTETQKQQIQSYLESVGIVESIDENLMDAVTGLSGSGPAYVFQFIESLAQGGLLAGLPHDKAQRLAIQTVIGAAQMVQQTQQNPAVLRDQVTSPGGTTIAGLKELHANGFSYAVMSAVEKAAVRASQLGVVADIE